MADRPAPSRRTGAAPRGGPRGRRRDATDAVPAVAEEPAEDGEAGPRWGGGDVLLGLLVAIAGSTLALWIVVLASGYAPFTPGPGFAAGYATGQTLVGEARGALDTLRNLPIEWRLVSQLGLWLGLIGVPVWAVARKGTSLRDDLGLAMEARDVPIGLALGAGLQAVAVPLLYVPIFWLTGEQDVGAEARGLADTATGPVGVVALFVIVGLGAPFAEELFYRGLAQRSFARRIGASWAIIAAAILFALMHLQELQFPALVLVGVVCGVLAQRTGRLGPAIWTHVGFNLVAAAALVWGNPLS